jgi:transcription initiation factor TFIIE subunit alpha
VLDPGGSDFGEEEEDVKPSIEYLNSLNEYHKRSRSTDDVGVSTSSSGKKVARMDLNTQPPAPVLEDVAMEMETQITGDDPLVYGNCISSLCRSTLLIYGCLVNGKSMNFSQVTEDHQELMTPEEYTAYFEVYQSQNP